MFLLTFGQVISSLEDHGMAGVLGQERTYFIEHVQKFFRGVP